MASVNKARERNAPKALQDKHRPKKYAVPKGITDAGLTALSKAVLKAPIVLKPFSPFPTIKGRSPHTLDHPWGREAARIELRDRLTGWLLELWEQARKELRGARPRVLGIEPEIQVHWDRDIAHRRYKARTQLRVRLVRDSGTQQVPGCLEIVRLYSDPAEALADRHAAEMFPPLQVAIRDNMGLLLQGEWPPLDEEDYVIPF